MKVLIVGQYDRVDRSGTGGDVDILQRENFTLTIELPG